MPRIVQRVSCSYLTEPHPRGSQTWDWQEKQRRLVWKFKKAPGGTEHTLQVPRLVVHLSVRALVCRCLQILDMVNAEFCSVKLPIQVSNSKSLNAGTTYAGGRPQSDAAGHWAHQLAVHGPDVVRLAAASAIPADPEVRQGARALPLGALRRAVRLVRCACLIAAQHRSEQQSHWQACLASLPD